MVIVEDKKSSSPSLAQAHCLKTTYKVSFSGILPVFAIEASKAYLKIVACNQKIAKCTFVLFTVKLCAEIIFSDFQTLCATRSPSSRRGVDCGEKMLILGR